MEKSRVYDLPTRIFHGAFAGLFLGAFGIAKLIDDDSPWFSQHMLLGLVLFFLTSLRILWGLLGSRYARFSSFPMKPTQLINYFKGIISSRDKSYFAHNPASAWGALTMIALALSLGITGYLMTTGQKELFEDIHELLANAFALVVIAHVSGVILHHLRNGDGIMWSMVHGKKNGTPDALPITNQHPIIAFVMAGLTGLFAFQVYKNYDPTLSVTQVFGITFQLGENEKVNELTEDDDD